jgi:hypothetical protein
METLPQLLNRIALAHLDRKMNTPQKNKMLQNSQLRKDIATLYEIKQRLTKTAKPDGDIATKVEAEALKAEAVLAQAIKALEALDDLVSDD